MARKRKKRRRDELRQRTQAPERQPPFGDRRLDEMPAHPSAQMMRQDGMLRLQREVGNVAALALLNRVQRENGDDETTEPSEQAGETTAFTPTPGGRGPGEIVNGTEDYYAVNGATLLDITDQLDRYEGYASETESGLGITGSVTPQRVDESTLRIEVEWAINEMVVRMPRWADYDTACTAAQQEWDRFMTQLKAHEQSAHVDAALAFVGAIAEADKVFTGPNAADLQRQLQEKQNELARQLQAIHDACDHGVGIDAILHPDSGRCE